MHPSLARFDHRPWPLPPGRWTWAQSWTELAFLHWPVPASSLRALIPPELVLQEHDGSAWIGVVPFRMMVRPRLSPPVPGCSYFPEINVRTYVEHDGKSGVWFLSLDATNPTAVRFARRYFHLPYFRAQIAVAKRDGEVTYRSLRAGASSEVGFSARYRPTAPPSAAGAGSIEHWLTERYCLYAKSPSGRLYRGDVHHAPWPLQAASVEVEINTMLDPVGLRLPGPPPLVHYSERIDVVLWPLRPV